MVRKTSDILEWVAMPQIKESRGNLVELDYKQLPFHPQRLFYVSNVPVGTERGGHAHIEGKQILFCLAGQVAVELRSGNLMERVICTNNGMGLLVKEGIWAKQTYLSDSSILLVLCSHPFNEASYKG